MIWLLSGLEGSRQAILPRLFPCKMTDPKMLREFGHHEVSQRQFFNELRCRFGLIDQDCYRERIIEADHQLAEFIVREVEPLERQGRVWWRRVLAYIFSNEP